MFFPIINSVPFGDIVPAVFRWNVPVLFRDTSTRYAAEGYLFRAICKKSDFNSEGLQCHSSVTYQYTMKTFPIIPLERVFVPVRFDKIFAWLALWVDLLPGMVCTIQFLLLPSSSAAWEPPLQIHVTVCNHIAPLLFRDIAPALRRGIDPHCFVFFTCSFLLNIFPSCPWCP